MATVVYFVRNAETGQVKIGHTYSLAQRLLHLRRRLGIELELLAEIPGGRRLEDRIHAHLIDLHLGREWFRPEPRLAELLAEIRAGRFDASKLPDGKSPIRSASAYRFHAARRLRHARAA